MVVGNGYLKSTDFSEVLYIFQIVISLDLFNIFCCVLISFNTINISFSEECWHLHSITVKEINENDFLRRTSENPSPFGNILRR